MSDIIYRPQPEFHFRPSFCRRTWDCWITQRTGNKTTHIAKPVVFVPDEPNSLAEPTMQIHGEDVQKLMDELWREGVRPTEQGTAGQLAAVSFHLEDMRRLVFKEEK